SPSERALPDESVGEGAARSGRGRTRVIHTRQTTRVLGRHQRVHQTQGPHPIRDEVASTRPTGPRGPTHQTERGETATRSVGLTTEGTAPRRAARGPRVLTGIKSFAESVDTRCPLCDNAHVSIDSVCFDRFNTKGAHYGRGRGQRGSRKRIERQRGVSPRRRF